MITGEYIVLVIAGRTVILYLGIVAAMRIMGKRQLGDLQPAELVVTLLIADLAAIPMQDNDAPLLFGLIPMAVLVVLELLFSLLMVKSPKAAALIGGRPQVVIHEGQPQLRMLRRLRISLDNLNALLRQQNVFDIQLVQCGIVETNGKLSVFLYPEQQPATREDTE